MFYKTVLPLILVAVTVTAGAENRWVTDEFEVMMRSGKSTRQSIVRQLPSGTQLEVLESDAESGYSRVRTGSGAEGWVLTRYLKRSPTAQLRLPELERKLKESEADRTRLRNQLNELTGEKRSLEREVGELQSANSSQEKQLTRITQLSASTIEVDQQNAQLRQRVAEAEKQIKTLEATNQQLASDANRRWFLIGAGVLIAGLLLGLILPRISWRKKSSWSDF